MKSAIFQYESIIYVNILSKQFSSFQRFYLEITHFKNVYIATNHHYQLTELFIHLNQSLIQQLIMINIRSIMGRVINHKPY